MRQSEAGIDAMQAHRTALIVCRAGRCVPQHCRVTEDARYTGADRIAARMRPILAPPPTREVEPGPAPSFSVIVAAYQVADVIADALDSIRAQTLRPLEVIVCDDGSTDALATALIPYRDEIVLLRQENRGESSARNAAARAASGDFVAILDADDVYRPGYLAAVSELAQLRPDLDILTTNGVLVADDAEIRQLYNRRWSFEVADQRRAILQRNFVFGLAAVRRSVLLEHGGFDESIIWTEDWDLWLRLILDGSSAGCVDEPLAEYRLRETSLTARRRELVLGKIGTLEKARANASLRDEERVVLEKSIASYRRELAFQDLTVAVATGDDGTRRRATALLLAPGFDRHRRVELAGMTLAPKIAGRVLRRRARDTWVGAGGIRVRRR
jgi:glycosyltransferase involved in cell wall biosynthesis